MLPQQIVALRIVRAICYTASTFNVALKIVPCNITLKQQREMTKLKFCGVRGTHDGEFLILSLSVNAIPIKYVPR